MRVYQLKYGCRPPCENLALVHAQMRAAHDYQNDLTAIERGRRFALRAIDDSSDDVAEAKRVVRAATKSTRRDALKKLSAARKVVRALHQDELTKINELEAQIIRDARALTSCYWGTYLDIENAARQARQMPLYGDDGLEPADPHFRSWREGRTPGQIGVQLQGGATTADVLAGRDNRVRLVLSDYRTKGGDRFGVLWLRVGSDGRAPIWTQVPVKLHRAIPDAARWKWVRLSLSYEALRPQWHCAFTVEDPAPKTRTLDKELSGAIAVEWDWTTLDDDRVRVASWADSRGERGEVVLPARVVRGVRHAEGIQAVRDLVLNDVRPKLLRAFVRNKETLPPWLARSGGMIEHQKSLPWFHNLVSRWRREKIDAGRTVYDLLQEWELRDLHLWEYQAGSRGRVLRTRREIYRTLAATWSRTYKTILLSDQDLSREAVFGEEGSARQLASCHEFRTALREAFGDDAELAKWRDKPDEDEDEERSWCERTRDAWFAGAARTVTNSTIPQTKRGGAWASRKSKKISPTLGSASLSQTKP